MSSQTHNTNAGVVLADVALTLAGRLTLEQFARLTMTTTFRRFFEHVIFQDLPFFDRLSPGELMARTSGDSLTLRQLISVTTYSVSRSVGATHVPCIADSIDTLCLDALVLLLLHRMDVFWQEFQCNHGIALWYICSSTW
jgi:ABC-type multidrug transport system fused ATPase/permease subunit